MCSSDLKSQSAKETPVANSSNTNSHNLTAATRNKSQSSATLLKQNNSSELRSPRAQSETPNTNSAEEEALYELLPLRPTEFDSNDSANFSTVRLRNKSFERFVPRPPSSETSLSTSIPGQGDLLHDNNHLALSRSSDSSLEGARSSSPSSSIYNTTPSSLNQIGRAHV